MREELYQRLLAAMGNAARTVGALPTARVVAACREILECDAPTATERFGLQSPFRQAYYLLAMMATAAEPAGAEQVSDDAFDSEWQRALDLVREIFSLYWEMYLPATPEELSGLDAERHERDGIALRAFLHQHNTGTLAAFDQVLTRVREVLGPFDQTLESLLGISATRAADIAEWIGTTIQQELDRFVAVLRRLKELYDEGIAAGLSREEMFARAAADEQLLSYRREDDRAAQPFCVQRGELAKQFGSAAASAFWSQFVTVRGSVQLPLGIDDLNPVELAPLFALSDEEALVPIINPLAPAIWRKFQAALDTPTLKERFAKRRGRVHESNVARVVTGYLGPGAKAFSSAFEREDAQLEHDLIAVLGRDVVVIEAKATPLQPVFRDPERAVARLRQQFRAEEGIQAGYEQAARIRRRLLDRGEDVPIYDRKGNLLHTFTPADVDEVYCVCVTAEDYGVLATDLSIFLERQPGEPYPWVVNAYDLEAFFEALGRRGWGPDKWLQYLRERRQLHGRVHASDELELAGVFIRHSSLRDLLEAKADMIVLGADMSNVFDEIFIEKQGGPPANLDPPGPIVWTDMREVLGRAASVTPTADGPRSPDAIPTPNHIRPSNSGATKTPINIPPMAGADRNQKCPCGSGKKFKKCHGTSR